MLQRIDASYTAMNKTDVCIRVECRGPCPQLLFRHTPAKKIFQPRTIIDRKGIVRHNRDGAGWVRGSQRLGSGNTRNTVSDYHKSLLYTHRILLSYAFHSPPFLEALSLQSREERKRPQTVLRYSVCL